MIETNRRETQASKKDGGSDVRVVVEVDGNPVGVLELDIDRLWPLLSHNKRERTPVEWVDPARFDSLLRAAVVKRLMSRLEQQLYRTLGDEIVKAQLDVETFMLRAETAAQTFGRSQADIDRLVAESGRTSADFYALFWEYLLDDGEGFDLKKEWKAARKSSQ
jgi:hypothetical protein